jgi:protease PrsW
MDVLFTLTLIFAAGFIPALLWLWLVLSEDRANPEPRKRLVISFLAGAVAVLVVLPFQEYIFDSPVSFAAMILLWALSEEIIKFAFSAVFALHTKDADEPIDEIIYLAATALGFAAFENMLFLWEPLMTGNISQGVIIAHMRFVGSTLVHLVSSIIIGTFLAETFFSSRFKKVLMVFVGIFIATLFHASYNLLIMDTSNASVLPTFMALWVTALSVLSYAHHLKKRYIIKLSA